MPAIHRMPEGWCIVLAGSWNPAILSPDWIAREIFGKAEVPVELGLAVGGVALIEMRFTDQGVGLAVEPARLRLYPLTLTEERMKRTEDFAVSLLDVLQHTPISAAGVNYQFRCADEVPKIATLFAMQDDETFIGLGLAKQKVEVLRSLDGIPNFGSPSLNLKFALEANTGRVRIELNFHYQVTRASQAKVRLGGAFVGLQTFTMQVLESYDAHLEETP